MATPYNWTVEQIRELQDFTPTSEYPLSRKAEEMGIDYQIVRRKFVQLQDGSFDPNNFVADPPKPQKQTAPIDYGEVLRFILGNDRSGELLTALQYLRKADELCAGLGVTVTHAVKKEAPQ